MIKQIILGILLAGNVFALSLNDADKAELTFENLIRNPGGESGKVGWTGTNVTVASETGAGNFRSGKASLKFTASSANGYVESSTFTVKGGTNNCEVSGYYKTTATDAKVAVYFGSTRIREETLPAASGLTKIKNFSFVCSDISSAYKVRFTFPTNGSVLYFDDGYAGLNRGLGSTAQAEFVGSVTWAATTNCQWSWDTYANATDNECDDNPRTVVGNVTDVSNGLRPAIGFTSKPGRYIMKFNGGSPYAYNASAPTAVATMRVYDGTNTLGNQSATFGVEYATTNAAFYAMPDIEFTETTPRTITADVQFKEYTATATAYLNVNSPFTISLYYIPTSSQTVARFDNVPAFAGVKIAADAAHTRTTAATSYTVVTDGDVVAGDKTHFGKAVITSTAGDFGMKVDNIPPGTYLLQMTAEMFAVYSGGAGTCEYGITDDAGTTSLGSAVSHSEVSSTAYDSIATVTAIVKYDSVTSKTYTAVMKNLGGGTGVCYFAMDRVPMSMTLIPLSQNLPQPLVINSVTTDFSGVLNLSGMIFPFAGATCPAGTLSAAGTAISRAAYSKLFAAIGTTWGAGDGSTTFNLPDLRGAFIRGTGTGTINSRNKAGPSVGSFQEDKFQGHKHSISDPGHTHSATPSGSVTTTDQTAGVGLVARDNTVSSSATTGLTVQNPSSDGTNGTPRTGAETYPYNAGVNYCVVQ